jgi:acylphosphatase
METTAMQRRTVHYAGRVQGVGFRYTVRQIAGSYAVTGYVQNLSDGRVKLVAEGEPVELDDFLAQITGKMTDYIHKIEPFISSATGEFDDFFIQR